MKLVQMKCPNCDANLSIEDGIESFFCQYCGTKIIVDEQSSSALKAKVAAKAIDKVGEMQKTRLEHKREIMRQKAEEEARNRKSAPLLIIIMVIMIIAGFSVLILPIHKENTRIETLYAEIQSDISVGNYDAALAKLPGLRYDSHVSPSKAKQWDETREDLIEFVNNVKEKS